MDRAVQIAHVIADCEERRDRGESLDREAILRSHPEIAEELRFHFELSELFGRAGTAGDPSPPGAIPAQVGDYRIVREIGRGGMGVVYEAIQQSMDRRVALKVLSAPYLQTANTVRRFQREARAGGRLHHTNIVPIHDMGQHEGRWYYAMDLVDGRALDRVVDELKAARRDASRSPVSAPTSAHVGSDTADRSFYPRVAQLFAGVAEALEIAHQAGVIHRDIKPSNLLLDAKGVLMIVDFGVAWIEDGAASMTKTGDLVGTPAYMSPEQAAVRRIEIDHRTDIYSLGATLYEVLTLEPPFRGERHQHICEQILTRDPVSARRLNQHLPRDLETIVLKAMEKERDKRYATAGELARDLRRFAEGGVIQARRVRMAGRLWRQVRRHRARSILAAGLLIALVLGGYLGLQVRAESQRRQELQYARLCVRAEHAVIATISAHGGSPDPGALFTEAIALAPDLPEAYLGRALLHTRPLQARLADLDAAQARGLPTRTWQVARAEFLGVPEPNLGAERETVPLHIYFEARRLADRQRWAEAQQELGRVLSARETGIALRYLALRLRVTACIKEDQHALALEDLLQMRALGDESASLCALIASQWRRLGESEMAETRFLEALEQAGKAGTEGSWLALCHDLHNFADHELLERAARAAVKAQPRSAKLHATLADALWHLGRHEEALAASDCALEIDPDRFSSHFQRGNALEALGRCEPALEAFDRAIGIDPESAAAHYNRGNALWSLGRIEESLAAYDRALDLDPQDGDAHGNRGDALVRLGRLEDAVIAFRRAFDLDPRADYQDKIGFALHSLGRNEEAVAAYEKALQLDDRSTYAMGGLAWGLATSTDPGVRNVPRAVAVARSGVALAPEDGGLWNTLGVALYRAGAWQESMSAFEKSMALGGGGTAYDWFFVAMLHARANREDKAREMYDKAVAWTKAHHPDDKELERFRSEAGEALASVAFGRR